MTELLYRETELASIKRKIRALSEKTVDRGCSEFEAMLAMKKVGDLLTQYNLSMTEVTMREEPCVTKSFQTDSKHRDVIWNVFSGLRKFCGLKTYHNRPPQGMCWYFFGLESDVDMALYLCRILSDAEDTAAEAFKKTDIYRGYQGGNRKPLTQNFKIGFGGRINERLYSLAREKMEAEKKAADFHQEAMKTRMVDATEEAIVKAAEEKTGTALICLAKEKMIEEEFEKVGPKLRNVTHRNSGRYNEGARDAGRAAGNKVNLGRPLNGGSKPTEYLS